MQIHTETACRPLGAMAALFVLLLASGCVTRTLVIRSQPEGARIHLDGREVGTTPLEMPFTWYGTREVILFKPAPTLEEARANLGIDENAYRLRSRLELVRPAHQFPGVDLASDLLWPAEVEDRQEFDFVLEPVPTAKAEADGPEGEKVRERAEHIRTRAREPEDPEAGR